MHTHALTCTKPPHGTTRCRTAYPRGSRNGPTTFLQLTLLRDPGGKEQPVALSHIGPVLSDGVDDPLLRDRDKRVIVLELSRPNGDGPHPVTEDGAYYVDIELGENSRCVLIAFPVAMQYGC